MKNKGQSERVRLIHAYSGIFTFFQTYPDIIRHIQESFRHILNPV